MENRIYAFIPCHEDFVDFRNALDSSSLSGKNIVPVLWDDSNSGFFDDLGMEYFMITQYAARLDFGNIRRLAMDFIGRFPHKKIMDGKSLVELLDYEGYSLWWFVRQGLYSDCVRILKQVSMMRIFIEEERISQIVISGRRPEFTSAVNEAARNKRVKIDFIECGKDPKEAAGRKFSRKLIDAYIPKLARIAQGACRAPRFFSKPGKRGRPRYNVLLFTRSHRWSNISGDIYGDSDSYTIMERLEASGKYNVLALDLAINNEAAWKAIKGKKKPFVPYDYYLFLSFIDPRIRSKIAFQKSRLRKLWEKLDNSGLLKEAMARGDISLFGPLRERMKSYFLDDFDSFPGAIRNIETAKRLIIKRRIDATISLDENGASRFLVFASKMCNIHSIALQHGAVNDKSIAYIYGKDDIDASQGTLNCQMVDKMAVFGRHYRDFLIEFGNYSKNSIEVTGQPRTDIFVRNMTTYSRAESCKRLGISQNKKIILYATQPLRDLSESRLCINAVVKSVRELKGVQLAIKLHPNDDPKIYTEALSALNFECPITKDADLYELLFSSDIVVGIYSSVLLEAVLMDKPVIQINLLEKHNIFGEYEKKVAMQASGEREISASIKSLLSDRKILEKMKKGRKKFISEYYHNIDGKCTERFVKALDSLLEENFLRRV